MAGQPTQGGVGVLEHDERFLDDASNVLFVGPPGVGKTMLSVALGRATGLPATSHRPSRKIEAKACAVAHSRLALRPSYSQGTRRSARP
ncbi:ATP-binding protein [Streptomyces sp. NBC_01450]|uniref:ATP-binding protein n=1 Tax=Streptomyces sp. NBC_01450 TaxID=2903871 RepID=UPI002E34D7E1|nr:ATP-binding protein [Streptomyces sp. NBC_01450]